MQPQQTSTWATRAPKIPELDQVKMAVVNSLGTAPGARVRGGRARRRHVAVGTTKKSAATVYST